MTTLKDMVLPGQKVRFQYYRNNELWYKTDTGFEFPVPISDTGDAVFLNEDKAILFMRYIRKHMNMVDEARGEHESKNETIV